MAQDSRFRHVLGGAFSGVLMLGFLIAILQLPILAIRDLIDERRQTEQEAVADITSMWGANQLISGPVLSIPFRAASHPAYLSEAPPRAYFTAKNIRVAGDVRTEVRYRGIFRVPVYTATLHISGTFDSPQQSDFVATANVQPNEIEVLWDQALVSIGVREPHKLREQVILKWDGAASEFRQPRPNEKLGTGTDSIHAIPGGVNSEARAHQFEISLTVNGSSSLEFLPIADETNVALTSSWPDPGFVGDALPITREVSTKGFSAEWKVLNLKKAVPTSWFEKDSLVSKARSGFGVSFHSPVDTYRMNERLIKYQLFIVFLTFLTFYIFELFNGLSIHPIQYLLIGAALCLFYLLTLSFSEHFGFAAAYAIAALSAVSLVWFYSYYVLGGGVRAATLGAVLSTLYGYFYVVLQEQDYALIFGSIGLTLILAAIMYITRNVDWYRIGENVEARPYERGSEEGRG